MIIKYKPATSNNTPVAASPSLVGEPVLYGYNVPIFTMPFVQLDGRLTWVNDQPQPAKAQRQLIEQAARLVADLAPDTDYVCVPVAPAGQPAVMVCFRLEGNDWVFDKME
jgi:hypothetical protein